MEPKKEGAVAEISESQIIADIQAALGLDNVVDDPSARTLGEIAKALGITKRAAESRVQKAVANGKLERVEVWRPDAAGRRLVHPAYRVVG